MSSGQTVRLYSVSKPIRGIIGSRFYIDVPMSYPTWKQMMQHYRMMRRRGDNMTTARNAIHSIYAINWKYEVSR